MIKHAGLVLDSKAHKVHIDNREVHIPPKQFTILEHMITNRGRKIPSEDLRVLTGTQYGESLAVHIHYLKKRIGRYATKIRSLRGKDRLGRMLAGHYLFDPKAGRVRRSTVARETI